jgi:hypothetical protein
VDLAQQFGYTTGHGQALRTAVDRPDPKLYEQLDEPHDRGSILVAAVFNAFFSTYQHRIKDLVRIATGGTGKLPEGDMHPDLVNRIAAEASKTAQQILTMCIRAFDYLPPVDVTFGDYLRALVTADFELNPVDDFGMRASMIEAFRSRGVYPDNVVSLAEESLLWEPADGLPEFPVEQLHSLILSGAQQYSTSAEPDRFTSITSKEPTDDQERDRDSSVAGVEEEPEADVEGLVAVQLGQYGRDNAAALGLDPNLTISVLGFHPVFRVAPRGQLLVEMVAQFGQHDATADEKFGGVPFRGATTVVASAEGKVRYVVAKPMRSTNISAEFQEQAQRRERRQLEFVDRADRSDPFLAWGDDAYYKSRIARRMNFAAMHRGGR